MDKHGKKGKAAHKGGMHRMPDGSMMPDSEMDAMHGKMRGAKKGGGLMLPFVAPSVPKGKPKAKAITRAKGY